MHREEEEPPSPQLDESPCTDEDPAHMKIKTNSSSKCVQFKPFPLGISQFLYTPQEETLYIELSIDSLFFL